MKVNNEPGVLSRSERFFSTPSATARTLFFYVTRVGHYYYDKHYDFSDTCDVAREESHKNFFLAFIRSGSIFYETSQQFAAERGQVALIDCHKPHHFYTTGDAEAMWIHFDGANAEAFLIRSSLFEVANKPSLHHLMTELNRKWRKSFPGCAAPPSVR